MSAFIYTDEACRQHDVDYLPPEDADNKLLDRVQVVSPVWAPMFVAAFEAKWWFEHYFTKVYTSSLYFFPDTYSPSLILHFAYTSVLDGGRLSNVTDDIKYQRQILLEAKWKKLLEEIWTGRCYKQHGTDIAQLDADPDDRAVSATSQPMDSSPTTSPQESDATPVLPDTSGSSATDCETMEEEVQYPQPPYKNGCKLIINEVMRRGNESGLSSVEHLRICPKGQRQPKSLQLTGYALVVLVSGDVIHQTLFASLHNRNVKVVKEYKPGTNRLINNYYFVLGTDQHDSLQFVDVQATEQFLQGIPKEDGVVVCIVLLHFGFDKNQNADLIDVRMLTDRATDNFIPTMLTDERAFVIKKYVQDVVIVGEPCEESLCGFFFELIDLNNRIRQEGSVGFPIQEEEPGLERSLSRCSSSSSPMELESFRSTTPSPFKMNNCPTAYFKYPFSLQGTALQKTAQKIIVNAKHFLEAYTLDPTLLNGSLIEKTSKLLGVGEMAIRRTLQNYLLTSINTPGKKRKRVGSVMKQFDQFRCDHVRKIIVEYYKNNVAPTAQMIYDKMIEDVAEEERNRGAAGETITPFTCSMQTFRKVLVKLGFKFGTINKRAVILMRADVMAKRKQYLQILKDNKNSASPRCVIYTGEKKFKLFSQD